MSHVQALVHDADTLHNQIMGNLDDVIWSLALPDLRPLYFNAAAARVYQASITELIKTDYLWLAAIATEDQFKIEQAITQAQESGSSQVTYRINQFNGEIHWFSARLKTFKDVSGLPIRIDAIANEVSENLESDHKKVKYRHNQTEEILFQSESRYRQIVQQHSDLILRSLADTTIIFANQPLCDMTGMELEQVIGQKWVDFANPDDLQGILQNIAALSPERPSFIALNRDRRPNNQIGWTQWLNKGIFNEQGKLIEIQSVGRDITTLKLSEIALKQLNEELELRIEQRTAALRKSEARNLSILNSLPDLLLLLKPDGTCIQCIMPANQDNSIYVPIQHHISEILHPENLAIALKMMAQAIATGELQVYEHKLIKLGKPVYEEVRIAPYCQDELLVIVRDISDRKLAEERLLRNDAHLKAAQRISKLGSWEFNLQTGEVSWSEEVFRIFGRDPASGTPSYTDLQKSIHPDDWEYFDQVVQDAISSSQSYDVEYRTCWEDGTVLYVSARGEIICDHTGQPIQIIGTAMDISDRKLAEAELNRNRDLREAIFNESTDALFIVDSQTLLTIDCNLPAVKLFEASDKAELIGIEGQVLQRYQFSDAEIAEINLDIQTKGYWSLEVEYITYKGSAFWGNLAVKPITIAGSTFNLVRVTDISDRKLAEAKILQTARQLENTNRELESFSYSVSHDLRAPLRHVNGFVNALKQQLKDHEALSNPKVAHYLQVIENSSQKMGQLIDGLLALSRYGRRPLESRPVSIRELVDEAIEMIRTDPSYNPLIEFAIGDLPTTVGDPTLLQQVFCNLIGNAIKFSRHQPRPYIEIDSFPDHTIRIKDNGVGFQMEYADKLFGAFQRLHNEKEFEGTGIGLAIVQRIVQRHGGSIWAEGYPDQGAIFFIKI